MNYILIAINIIAFFLTAAASGSGQTVRPWFEQFVLHPQRPHIWQYISYAFLHAGIWHIAGNMYFLYLFGNNVNDRLGNVGYLAFYLSGAVFSALGHSLLSASPVVGASGAVAAVTGAYLVLFPQTLITVIYFFFFIGTINLPAIYFIGIKMIFIDNILARGQAYVAYDAHLAGYAFGILLSMALLAAKLLPSTHFDLWAMLRQWNRRRKYRDAVSNGYEPFVGSPSTKRKKIKIKQVEQDKPQPDQHIIQTKNEIISKIGLGDLPAAAEMYRKLLLENPNFVMSKQYQLDIANRLMSDSKFVPAAKAYELFIKNYPKYQHIEQVYLMLGLIYSRYLEQPEPAIHCLQKAEKRLKDNSQLQMCRQELRKLT
jgi:membrane associated rhomboid family serine protease